jgi:hypothetical protein
MSTDELMSAQAADVAKLVARVEELERFGRELRKLVWVMVRLVEGAVPE